MDAGAKAEGLELGFAAEGEGTGSACPAAAPPAALGDEEEEDEEEEPQFPIGGVSGPVSILWTYFPTFGNLRSVPLAAVEHPLPIFATNMSGSASNASARSSIFE